MRRQYYLLKFSLKFWSVISIQYYLVVSTVIKAEKYETARLVTKGKYKRYLF